MASHGAIGDPRIEMAAPVEPGVKPVVTLPRAGLSTLAIAIGAVIAGLILFSVLDARRRAATAPAVMPRASDVQVSSAPPPLYVPVDRPPPVMEYAPRPTSPPAAQPAPAPAAAPRTVYVQQSAPPPQSPPIETPRATGGPALVVDTSAAGAPASAAGEAPAAEAATAPAAATITGGGRARSGMFANRATTVPQGTIIQAVLETALDSTRPGFARAIVSRDVRGFDGSRILIPRGSRLIGEYRSDVAPGQRRALVNWVRLIRPDGVTIAIGSPAGDPLGRGGVRARVNTHFFERFAGAILQSALDIGVAIAGRSASNGTVVILPGVQGVTQTTTQVIQPAQITNTLTVRQGTSISIFAARDLDFTGAERRR